MNIDVVQPKSRLELGLAKCTALGILNRELWVGTSNGEVQIYRNLTSASSDNEADTTKIAKDDATPKIRPLKSHKLVNDIRSLFNKPLLQLQSKFTKFKHTGVSSLPIRSFIEIGNQDDGINENDGNPNAVAVADDDSVSLYSLNPNTPGGVKHEQTLQTNGCVDMTFLSSRKLLFIATNTKKVAIYCLVLAPNSDSVSFQHITDVAFKVKLSSIQPITESEVLVATSGSFMTIDVDNSFTVMALPLGSKNYFALSSSFSYFALNSGPTTHAVPLVDETKIHSLPSQFFLVKDDTIIRWNSECEDDDHRVSLVPIKSSLVPSKVIYLSPRYLLLIYSKKFDVVDYEDGEVIQTFYHNASTNSIQYVLSPKENMLYIGSSSEMFQYEVVSVTKQVESLLELPEPAGTPSPRGRDYDVKLWGIERAIKLASSTSFKNQYFSKLGKNNEKLKQLKLRELYQKESIHLFVHYEQYHQALVRIACDWILDLRNVLALFPKFLNTEELVHNTTSPPPIRNKIRETKVEEIENLDITIDSSTETDAATGNRSVLLKKPISITRKRFLRAVNNLIMFLTEQRRIFQNFQSKDHEMDWHGVKLNFSDLYGETDPLYVARVVDTSLFLCYFYVKPMMLGPLLRLPNNHCDSNIVNECLLRNLHDHGPEKPTFIKELLDFYFGRSLHKEALLMLYDLAHDKQASDHENDLDVFLKEPSLTIQYLQKLYKDNWALILEFSEWVLKESENTEDQIERAKLLFMNDSIECESYDSFQVVDFLSDTIKSIDCTIEYLEWLILETNHIIGQVSKKKLEELHTKLCLSYLNKLKEEDKKKANRSENEKNTRFEKPVKTKKAESEIVDKIEMDNEGKAIIEDSIEYKKLLQFLESTQLYEPWTVLKYVPTENTNFLRISVSIYRRLGEHEKSIDVLFNQLDDLDAAMDYCSEIYYELHKKQTGVDLLHKLLDDMLVNTPNNTALVTKLLDVQGQKMSVLRVLDTLPQNFAIANVGKYLSNSMRSSKESLYDSRLTSQLYKVGLIKLKSKVLEARKECISIPNSRQLCAVCHKKLGYSVYSVNSSGQVCHYGCFPKESN